MKHAILAVLLLAAPPAFAGGSGDHHPTTHELNRASAAALSASSSTATVTNNVSAGRGGDYGRSAFPSALGGLSSGVCSGVSGGITVAVPVVGVGIQGGGLDDDCTIRNNALVVDQLGQHDVAVEMLRELKGYSEARGRLGR
jgi:hypothetical protein